MLRSAAFAAGWCLMLTGSLRAAGPSEPTFADVVPLFEKHCAECHGGDEPQAKLDLRAAPSLVRGGESGPPLVPGEPDDSLLWQLIADGSMPPDDKPRLADDERALVRAWIAAGAAGVNFSTAVDAVPAIDPEARAYFAFRPLAVPTLPAIANPASLRTDVDAFIVARLEQVGLQLAPEADRAALLRRVSFDLIGLPPTSDELAAFLADTRPDAYERVVDRLLASPHFGERWGRHWLDAAGYSDITGGDNDAGIVKLSHNKWKYRDYVVRAFNDDLPYGRFLVEQLAGDELVDWRSAKSFTPETTRLLVATGFLRHAADDTDEKELTTQDILHGVLQRTGEVVANNLLGLTLACAKCHDHKYEPIPQRDYYRFMAAFTPVFNPQSWLPPRDRALADISPAEKKAAEEHNAQLDRTIQQLRDEQAAIKRPTRETLLAGKLATLPEPIRADVQLALDTAADKRSEVQKYLAEKFQAALDVPEGEVDAALDQPAGDRLAELESQIAAAESTRRHWDTIQAAYDVGPPPPTYLLRRGNHETPAAEVEPGFFSVLGVQGRGAAQLLSAASDFRQPAGETSGRRLALACWLTDWQTPSGALAARVRVNRVWQHLFGTGIVATSENLGVSGAAPTHPELLECLACRFVADGCRTKPLVKLLVTSAVYRQASTSPTADQAVAADPGNALLWHMPLRRLEAETVRDALLATSGQLDPALGGPALSLEVRPDGMVVLADAPGASTSRRSLYVLARRNYHLSLLGAFDAPTMSTNCPRRQSSAVVSQSLAMLNDEQIVAAAEKFARRVTQLAASADAAARIDLAFRLALSRPPTGSEMAAGQEFLSQQAAELSTASKSADDSEIESPTDGALVQLCHMLLASNEFLYVP